MIPPFRRSEDSARYPPRAAGLGYIVWGRNAVCGLDRLGQGVELAGGAVAAVAVLVSSGRMRPGWLLVGHTRSTHYCAEGVCVGSFLQHMRCSS